jgi:IS605 OrfB family transposase
MPKRFGEMKNNKSILDFFQKKRKQTNLNNTTTRKKTKHTTTTHNSSSSSSIDASSSIGSCSSSCSGASSSSSSIGASSSVTNNNSTTSVTSLNKPFWWNDKVKELSDKIDLCYLDDRAYDRSNDKCSWSEYDTFENKVKTFSGKIKWDGTMINKDAKETVNKRSRKKIEKDQLIRCRKIRIVPTKQQKMLIHQWMNIIDLTYNNTLNFIFDLKDRKKINWRKLRKYNLLVYSKKSKEWNIAWKKLKAHILNNNENKSATGKYKKILGTKNCPYDPKTEVIHQLCSTITSTKESLKSKGKPLRFEMKKRDQNRLRKSIDIPVNGGNPSLKWDDTGFYFWPSKINRVKVKFKRELEKLNQYFLDGVFNSRPKSKQKGEPSKFQGQCHCTVTLKYESPGRYYMIVPILKRQTKTEPRNENFKFISFDPGVKTFQTGMDHEGNIIEIGKESINRICSITKKANQFQSKEAKSKNKKKRKKYKKQKQKLLNRIDGLKKDFHWKLSKRLAEEYDHIIISKFQVSGMVQKTRRKISKETCKLMLNWSHFHFRQRLKQKAQETSTIIHEVSEHYTSKACSKCGNVHWKLGSNRVYRCPSCYFYNGRDWQAAKNILIKNFHEIGFALCEQ